MSVLERFFCFLARLIDEAFVVAFRTFIKETFLYYFRLFCKNEDISGFID
jgi:hypothetical protein